MRRSRPSFTLGVGRIPWSLDSMLRIIPLLGLVVGLVACRAPERVAELGQRAGTPGRSLKVGQIAERPGGILAPVFLREHGGESSFEPKTRSALSAEEASVLAARLANDQRESRYQRRPFKPEQYPPFCEKEFIIGANWMLAAVRGFLRQSPFIQMAASLMWKSIFQVTLF
jgi:hypothetical protein